MEDLEIGLEKHREVAGPPTSRFGPQPCGSRPKSTSVYDPRSVGDRSWHVLDKSFSLFLCNVSFGVSFRIHTVFNFLFVFLFFFKIVYIFFNYILQTNFLDFDAIWNREMDPFLMRNTRNGGKQIS